jgi:alpha-D-ribose 1-methylphosphonate 5-phosphate C-P lyase
MSPSPIPRWDVPKLHQAAHLTLLSAGREKRLYAVPPFTDVQPLAFDDIPFRIEKQTGWVCWKSGGSGHFMTEIPQPDGTVAHEISDTSVLSKLIKHEAIAPAYYDARGGFHIDGVLHS